MRDKNISVSIFLLLLSLVVHIRTIQSVNSVSSSDTSTYDELSNIHSSSSSQSNSGGSDTSSNSRCQEISIPMCKGIGYNMTAMPNIFHHDSQEEAGLEVHQFWPLVEINCSDDLKFFLCSIYTPICMEDYTRPLPACRQVCERAKTGCAPIMKQYNFDWPDRMNCEELPLFKEQTVSSGDMSNLCMDPKNGEEAKPPPPHKFEKFYPVVPLPKGKGESKLATDGSRSEGPYSGRGHGPTSTGRGKKVRPGGTVGAGSGHHGGPNGSPPVDCKCECRLPLIKLEDNFFDRRYENRVETAGIVNCAQPCKSPFFSPTDLMDSVSMITVFAFACFICTFFTVATFLMDRERFKYPERCIIFICGCYLMVSSGFLLRWYLGHEEVACNNSPIIHYSGTGPASTPCMVTFLLIYYFTMASSVWWVILCVTWYLAAGLKWSNEAITGYSLYYHLIAIAIPTIKSFIILGMMALDGDSFTGICYVGNLSNVHLKNFILTPLIVYLVIGLTFLIAGFVSMYRIREMFRQQAYTKADKLEKLMVRIVIFSFLYVVPGLVVITCNYYEYTERNNWLKDITCPCSSASSSSASTSSLSIASGAVSGGGGVPSTISTGASDPVATSASTYRYSGVKAFYYTYLLKYIGSLVVGITSGFWIISPKTLESWSKFFSGFCCRNTIATTTGNGSISGHRRTRRHSLSSRSGGSQLISSQYMNHVTSHHRANNSYKQILSTTNGGPISYSSTSHIGSNCNAPGVLNMKQVPLTHV